jgi:hypothetical protein
MARLDARPDGSPIDDHLLVGKFRLVYLVYWIAATAALAVIANAATPAVNRVVGPWTSCLLHTMHAAVFGAVLVGAGVLARSSRFAHAERLQPGHWLVVNSAVVGILLLLLSPLLRYVVTQTESQRVGWGLLLVVTYCLMNAALSWFAMTRLPDTEKWKAAFRFFALAHLFAVLSLAVMSFCVALSTLLAETVVVLIPMFATAILALLAVVSFVRSVVADLRTRCDRDWIHWLGVAAVVSYHLIGLAWRLAGHFALP